MKDHGAVMLTMTLSTRGSDSQCSIEPQPQSEGETLTLAIRPPGETAMSNGTTGGAIVEAQRSGLIQAFTFDSFIAGQANALPHAVALQIARKPADDRTPLYIHGAVGLGKTHLAHAIANAVQASHPDARIACRRSDELVGDVVRAYQHRTFEVFERYYRSLDVLAVDGIQFLDHKERTQEELRYIVIDLVAAGKLVVVTGDLRLKEMQGLDARLISILAAGVSIELVPPDIYTRVAILEQWASAAAMNLPDDVATFIAASCPDDVRLLQGAWNLVTCYAAFYKSPIDLALARSALATIQLPGPEVFIEERSG